MHPSIRILSCVIFILLASQADWFQLVVFSVILVALIIFTRNQAISSTARMIWRLRWLGLSIFIVSAWFTPGEYLFPTFSTWSPTVEGTAFALKRLLILVEIVTAVNILLITTKTIPLVTGLQQLLRPFSSLGINVDRLAVRIVMTLDEIKSPSVDLTKLVEETRGKPALARVTSVAVSAYKQTLLDAGDGVGDEVSMESLPAPALIQLLWPCLLPVIFFLPLVVV